MYRCLVKVLFGTLLLAQAALAATTVNVDVQTHTQARNADTKAPPDVHWQATLIFAGTAVAVRTTTQETVYDFQNKKRVVIDLDANTYTRYSLFDTLGFRILELQNRQRMLKGLTAAGLEGAQPTLVDLEHVLSVQAAGPVKLDQSFDEGAAVFSGDGHELARWADVGIDATPADMQDFVRFIRYSTGGHPQVLAQLGQRHSIPKELTFTFNQIFGVTSSHIVVSGRSSVDWNDNYLARYTMATSANTPIDTLLNKSDHLNGKDFETATQKIQDQIKSAETNRRPVAMFLGYLEASLMSGAPIAVPDSFKIDLQASPEVQQIAADLPATEEKDLEHAIQSLTDLRAGAGDKAYVLELFEANDRLHLGDFPAAARLFDQVITANPALVSAYKDFGDLLVLRYDLARAWRCWDIGRRLNAKFPNFAPVDDFEKKLASEHPEYF